MKIFLIGMPGSGKTTLGKQLASRLNVDFVDLDTEIEKAETMSISEIFASRGEDYFRLLESRLLRQWASGHHSFVMATGGGAPCFHKGVDVINEYGISIFLDCPVSELIARVRRNRERPLLLASDDNDLKNRLDTMRERRLACYRKAAIVLEDPSLANVLRELDIKR